MKAKKILLIITALCCTMTISACNKKQNDTGNADNAVNVSRETTASKAEANSSETTVIDVFSELNVTFEGENGSGKIICEYTGDNEFIKYDVEFKCDRNGSYKNGDTAVIKLDYSDYRAESANVFFKEKDKEYTVEGLWGVIQSADGYDFSECNKALSERMFDKERSDSKFNIKDLETDKTFFTTYVDGETVCATWKVLSAEYEPLKGKLFIPETSYEISNDYYLFYKATVMCEAIAVNYSDSQYAVGDKKEWHFVISEKTWGVFVEKDSNIVKVNPKAYVAGGNGGELRDVMSISEIHGRDDLERDWLGYKDFDNFDEYFEKRFMGNFYDIELK